MTSLSLYTCTRIIYSQPQNYGNDSERVNSKQIGPNPAYGDIEEQGNAMTVDNPLYGVDTHGYDNSAFNHDDDLVEEEKIDYDHIVDDLTDNYDEPIDSGKYDEPIDIGKPHYDEPIDIGKHRYDEPIDISKHRRDQPIKQYYDEIVDSDEENFDAPLDDKDDHISVIDSEGYDVIGTDYENSAPVYNDNIRLLN